MPKKDDISKDQQPLPDQDTVSNTWKVSSSMVDICPVLPAQVASRVWISLRGMNDILTYIYLIFYGKSVGKYAYIYIYTYMRWFIFIQKILIFDVVHFAQLGSMGLVAMTLRSITCQAFDICVESISSV